MKPHSIQRIVALAALFLAAAGVCRAQGPAPDPWPKSILTAAGTVISLYQPTVLSLTGNTLKTKSVISVMDPDDEDPLFGVAWTTSSVSIDSTQVAIQSVSVDDLRLTGDSDRSDRNFISAAIEVYMPWVVKTIPVAEVNELLLQRRKEVALARDSSIPTPKVLYRSTPTVLVLIDGEPRLAKNEAWGVDAVVNSRYVIVKDKYGKYYLYGGGHWYVAPAATGPYSFNSDKVSKELRKISSDLKKAAHKDDLDMDDIDEAPVYDIAVSTVPAVLIQSSGPVEPAPVAGTGLKYIMNSRDNIFTDSVTRQYYVLADRQWYRSASLTDSSAWHLVSPGALPQDFARIPVNSLKSEVLEDVAGTPAHNNLTREAQAPQTIKVDRSVTAQINYDGPPAFSPITGTRLRYATNTCSIVLEYNGEYYALDDGVWFVASSPIGEWTVADRRPLDVELIPRSYRAYGAKFVYIYQTEPEVVYEGYLPGYEDDLAGDCALSETYDYEATSNFWSFDLDCIFGWGGGWYDGFYWFNGRTRFYGHGGGGRWGGKRPWASGGGQRYAGGGTSVGGGSRAPHPPRGWRPRMQGNGHVIGFGNGWAGQGSGPRHVGRTQDNPGGFVSGNNGFGRNAGRVGAGGNGPRRFTVGGNRGGTPNAGSSRFASGGRSNGGSASRGNSGGSARSYSGGGSRGGSSGGGSRGGSSGGGGHASSGGSGGGGGHSSGGGGSSGGGHH